MRIAIPEEHQAFPTAYVRKSYAPDIVLAGMRFSDATYANSKLSLREFEGARIRTAHINGCVLCLNWRSARDLPAYRKAIGKALDHSIAERGDAVPDEAFYAAVLDWRTSPVFSDRERLVIEYAELLGLDPHRAASDEDFWMRAKAAFSDEEIVDMSYCIACWMGLGRVTHALGLDSICSFGPAVTEDAEAQAA